jgi:hypothetical protein
MDLHGAVIAIASISATKSEIPLGLSSVPNLTAPPESLATKERAKRGSKGISSRSRQLVRDSATLLEEKYGKAQLAFITHTIPSKFVDCVHSNWARILHNLRRRYTRALQKADLPQDLIMITEYQEARLASSGKAVLHLHIVFVGRRRKQHWEYDCEYYKKHWQECCEECCEESSDNAEWHSATRVEGIRKSCASYLAKYMSKGVSTLSDILSSDPDAFIPSSWHVLTQVLRTRVRKATRHFEGESATTLFEWILNNAVELLKFNRFVKVPTSSGREVCVGWYGDLKDKTLFRSLSVL